jgi:hypothetical protein
VETSQERSLGKHQFRQSAVPADDVEVAPLVESALRPSLEQHVRPADVHRDLGRVGGEVDEPGDEVGDPGVEVAEPPRLCGVCACKTSTSAASARVFAVSPSGTTTVA